MREVVVAICTIIITALVFYIAQDFLTVELAEISDGLRRYAVSVFFVACCWMLAWVFGKHLREFCTGSDSLLGWIRFLGESRNIRLVFSTGVMVASALSTGVVLWAVGSQLLKIDESKILAIGLAVALLSIGMASLIHSGVQEKFYVGFRGRAFLSKSRQFTMVTWRLHQMLFRNRSTQAALFAALISVQLFCFLVNGPFFVLVLLTFFIGLLMSMAMAFQAHDDLTFAWCERQLGVSHDDFINAYVRIGSILGFWGGFLLFALLAMLNPQTVFLDTMSVIQASKLIAICYVPCFMMPYLLFQVDVRRPIIQAMTVTMLGLLVITAIYAHWVGVLILPIFRYYAGTGQLGRYYRS